MKAPLLNISSVRAVLRYDTQPYENAFAVTVTAAAPAAFVWMETQYPGRWSDNGFLMTQESIELTFYQDTSSHHCVPPDQLLLGAAARPTAGHTLAPTRGKCDVE
jgi:hypothetical protein